MSKAINCLKIIGCLNAQLCILIMISYFNTQRMLLLMVLLKSKLIHSNLLTSLYLSKALKWLTKLSISLNTQANWLNQENLTDFYQMTSMVQQGQVRRNCSIYEEAFLQPNISHFSELVLPPAGLKCSYLLPKFYWYHKKPINLQILSTLSTQVLHRQFKHPRLCQKQVQQFLFYTLRRVGGTLKCQANP